MTKPSDPISLTTEQTTGHACDNDKIFCEITELAGVQTPFKPHFRNAIEQGIKEARNIAKESRVASTDICAQLGKLENDVENLRARLVAEDHMVLNFINAALWAKFGRQSSSIEQYISHLETLSAVTKSAKEEAHRTRAKRGRPAGLRTPFDAFVYLLVTRARSYGGQLTIYKSDHAESNWDGSLLKAIRLLEPLLPHDFFPKGNLGQRLSRIAEIAGL